MSTLRANSFERQIRDQRSYAFISLVYANCNFQRNLSSRKIKSRKKFLSFMSSLPTFEAGQKILRTWSDSAYEDHWNANAADYFSWSTKHRRMAKRKRVSHFSAIKWILMSPRYSCRSASSMLGCDKDLYSNIITYNECYLPRRAIQCFLARRNREEWPKRRICILFKSKRRKWWTWSWCASGFNLSGKWKPLQRF